jgi:hypothetical protein
MRSRIGWLLLCTPLAACGATAEPSSEDPTELPFGMGPLTDSAVAEDAGGRDAGSSKPSARLDGSVGQTPIDVLDEDSACAAASVAAEQVVVEEQVQVAVEVKSPAPVALYVMFDKSLSMSLSNLWTPAVQAFTGFVHDPASSGMDLALQYFPSGGACNGTGYSTPAVALGRLPGHANALTTSIGQESPTGIGTPIEGALRGATTYCKTFQAAHPDERCVAVLVTDGRPEYDSCEKDSTKLAAIADQAWKQSQVRTFAVGLSGADFTLLDKIAVAGGASDCDPNSARFSCDVSSGPERLTAALTKIRDTVTTVTTHTELQTTTQTRPLECEWRMPTPQAGAELDAERVNVTLSGGSAGTHALGRVPNLAACSSDAWYYDVPSAPTRIVACPQTCETIKSGGYADVKILLGCQTQVILL